jgi:hypothetical protein
VKVNGIAWVLVKVSGTESGMTIFAIGVDHPELVFAVLFVVVCLWDRSGLSLWTV